MNFRNLLFLVFYSAGFMASTIYDLGTAGKVVAIVIGAMAGWYCDDAAKWVAGGAQ